MKKITLFFACFITIALCAQNTGKVATLLDRLDSYGDIPLSMSMVIERNFTADEQAILFGYFEDMAKKAQSNTAQNSSRLVPAQFYVENIRAGQNFGTLDSAVPFQPINTIKSPLGFTCFAGDFDPDGILYALEFLNDAAGTPVSRKVITIDINDGTVATVFDILSTTTDTPSGLSYNFVTSRFYATVGSNLYELNLAEGSFNLVGNTGLQTAIWLVIDNDGNAFTSDITTDIFYSVNLTTGLATAIGPLGVNLQFAQDATVDHADNTIYIGSYTGGGVGGFYTVNKTTGAATLFGDTQPLNAEFGIVAVQGGPILGVNEQKLSQISLYPNPAKDLISIKLPASVEIKSTVLYDVLGKTKNINVKNGQINVSELANGVYFLKMETSAGTLTKKFIKE